jgi:hypothetical protein
VGFVETKEEVCGLRKNRRHMETPWQTDRIKEATNRKNDAWREWFNERPDERRNGKD